MTSEQERLFTEYYRQYFNKLKIYAEIACSLGITERACQKRVERAKNKLKKYLKDDNN